VNATLGALQAGKVWDALDLLLLVVVLYQIFVVFKGTRTVQMAAGVVGLVAATYAARRLDLFMSGYVLDSFWSFWVLALIVLFQPELRRAFAQAGQSPIFRGMTRAGREQRSHVIDDVIKAADALAGKRMGALIVMERSMELRQYAELGVPLDAIVSADLLVSLFLPYSPLHDGAVLIRDGRVSAAGCFLPLSRNTQLGRQMGTRHRAALGLSEETDAVVLAVSEESGGISLSVAGRIETPLDREALRGRLADLFALKEGAAHPRAAAWRAGLGWLRK
jgi:diadenylate cyclase